jgi:hypothetical protein
MLVHVKKIHSKQEFKDQFLISLHTLQETPPESFALSKRDLCFCMQMLQKNEFSTVFTNSNYCLNIKNVQGNQFVVELSTPIKKHILCCIPDQVISPDLQSSTLPKLLNYLHNQNIPQHKHCVMISGQMQQIFGFITHKSTDNCILPRRMDDNFLLDNATNISKLTDILNSNLHLQLPSSILCPASETEHIINLDKKIRPAYSALQLKLASIFCATAFKDIPCMWHVSQNMMSDMSCAMLKALYDKPPEKGYVTLLLKGDSVNERIYRINLSVRFFPVDHEFTSKIMPTAMAMNASESKTGVLVLTGVQNNIAAAIYHNSDTQTMLQNKISFAAYMGSL